MAVVVYTVLYANTGGDYEVSEHDRTEPGGSRSPRDRVLGSHPCRLLAELHRASRMQVSAYVRGLLAALI